MRYVLAIADLRLREAIAARLLWLVALAFLVGVGAALWVGGPDLAARTDLADRIVLRTTWGLAFVVAAILPAIGLPSDIRTGAAQNLFASPASRIAILFGGTLGYGAFAALLLAAMAGASVLGMQVAGLGSAQREPVREVTSAELVGADARGIVTVAEPTPVATFRVRVPAGLREGESLRVRFAPRARYESGFDRAATAAISVHRPGEGETAGATREIPYKSLTPFTVEVPLVGLTAGDEAEITLRRLTGRWTLLFGPGSVEVGGPRELYSMALLRGVLCVAPFLFVLSAVGALGAARFGVPTAVVLATFLFLVLVGQEFIAGGARFLVDLAEHPEHAHSHAEQGHESHEQESKVAPARVALARGALAVLDVLPAYPAFDRTNDLVERRGPGWRDVGRAAVEGLAPIVVLTGAGWLLVRRRELAPGS